MKAEIDLYDEICCSSEQSHSATDLDVLGRLSESFLKVETSENGCSEANNLLVPPSQGLSEIQKNNYTENIYRLILTARKELQQNRKTIDLLNARVESHSIVSCPSCQNKFKTGQNRFLPSYVRVLRGSNRVELQFDDNQHMEEWLIASDLDRDKRELPIIQKEKATPLLEDVGSKITSTNCSILEKTERQSMRKPNTSTDERESSRTSKRSRSKSISRRRDSNRRHISRSPRRSETKGDSYPYSRSSRSTRSPSKSISRSRNTAGRK